jgi:hypothetical protein
MRKLSCSPPSKAPAIYYYHFGRTKNINTKVLQKNQNKIKENMKTKYRKVKGVSFYNSKELAESKKFIKEMYDWLDRIDAIQNKSIIKSIYDSPVDMYCYGK